MIWIFTGRLQWEYCLKGGKKKTDLSAHFPATEHKVYQVRE